MYLGEKNDENLVGGLHMSATDAGWYEINVSKGNLSLGGTLYDNTTTITRNKFGELNNSLGLDYENNNDPDYAFNEYVLINSEDTYYLENGVRHPLYVKFFETPSEDIYGYKFRIDSADLSIIMTSQPLMHPEVQLQKLQSQVSSSQLVSILWIILF